jgi:hypothetical protein
VIFAPLADVAKGGDGAKSAFRGYSLLGYWLLAIRSGPDPDLVQMRQEIGGILIHPISPRSL